MHTHKPPPVRGRGRCGMTTLTPDQIMAMPAGDLANLASTNLFEMRSRAAELLAAAKQVRRAPRPRLGAQVRRPGPQAEARPRQGHGRHPLRRRTGAGHRQSPEEGRVGPEAPRRHRPAHPRGRRGSGRVRRDRATGSRRPSSMPGRRPSVASSSRPARSRPGSPASAWRCSPEGGAS